MTLYVQFKGFNQLNIVAKCLAGRNTLRIHVASAMFTLPSTDLRNASQSNEQRNLDAFIFRAYASKKLSNLSRIFLRMLFVYVRSYSFLHHFWKMS